MNSKILFQSATDLEIIENLIKNYNEKYGNIFKTKLNLDFSNEEKIIENVPVEIPEEIIIDDVPVEIPEINENIIDNVPVEIPDLINNPVAAAPKIKTYNCEVCQYFGKDPICFKKT